MFMRKSLAVLCLALSSTHLIGASGLHRSLIPDGKIVGRWDVTIQEANGGQYPSWFEVTGEGGNLTGRFVGRVGSQRPSRPLISRRDISHSACRFSTSGTRRISSSKLIWLASAWKEPPSTRAATR